MKLTEMQEELFPQLLATYLQQTGGKGIEESITVLSDSSKVALYALVNENRKASLTKELNLLEEAKSG